MSHLGILLTGIYLGIYLGTQCVFMYSQPGKYIHHATSKPMIIFVP